MGHVVELVLEVVDDTTFSVLFLDDLLGAVDCVLDSVVISSLALSLASASASVASDLDGGLGVLLHAGDWVDVGHFLDCLELVLSLDDFSLFTSVQFGLVVQTQRLADDGGLEWDGGSVDVGLVCISVVDWVVLVGIVSVVGSSWDSVDIVDVVASSLFAAVAAVSLSFGFGFDFLGDTGHWVVE